MSIYERFLAGEWIPLAEIEDDQELMRKMGQYRAHLGGSKVLSVKIAEPWPKAGK